MDKTVRTHRSCLHEALEPGTAIKEETGREVEPVERPKVLDSYGNERPIVTRMQERYTQVQALKNGGASLNAISRQLGLAFRTARKYAGATSVDVLLAPTLSRSSKLDQFKPYLTRRWNEGCTNAIQFHAEINAQGFTGADAPSRAGSSRYAATRNVRQEPCLPPKPRRVTG
ncbi:hypothetical protein ACIA8R_52680 [Nonomuraea sp. NPDC051191]|uniref:hypothetical protein n=1 Tax=Nonomuraea sp. NPDC051191 TaxID=3364372 RepID=UPI00379F6935